MVKTQYEAGVITYKSKTRSIQRLSGRFSCFWASIPPPLNFAEVYARLGRGLLIASRRDRRPPLGHRLLQSKARKPTAAVGLLQSKVRKPTVPVGLLRSKVRKPTTPVGLLRRKVGKPTAAVGLLRSKVRKCTPRELSQSKAQKCTPARAGGAAPEKGPQREKNRPRRGGGRWRGEKRLLHMRVG